MEGILLSIIIPVYNTEKYLNKCLDSIVLQSFKNNVEVICIDDGSTDTSGDICDSYAKKYDFIKVIHVANGGVAKARNIGLDYAKGKYIAWIDSDDYISIDWYDDIEKYIHENYDLIYFDMKIVFQNGGSRNKSYSWRSKDLSFEVFHYDLAAGLIASHLWSKVCKREYWDNIRFGTDMSYCEDYSLLHRVLINTHKIRYIHKPLYNYLQREDSLVHDADRMNENTLLGIRLVEKRLEFYKRRNVIVSFDGMYLAIDVFLWNYLKSHEKMKYRAYYDKYLSVLQNAILKWLFSSRITWRKKIQMLLIVTRLAEITAKRL